MSGIGLILFWVGTFVLSAAVLFGVGLKIIKSESED